MRALRFILLALAAATVFAAEVSAQTIVRKKDAPVHEEALEKVVIDGDTVSVILPSVISAVSTAVFSTTYSYPKENGASVSLRRTASFRPRT